MASDQPLDFDATASDRSAQVIQIDNGKHVAAVAICAVVCGLCAALSWWAVSKQGDISDRYHGDSVDWQNQHERERNHVIELEARLKILGDEVQEIKHERRLRYGGETQAPRGAHETPAVGEGLAPGGHCRGRRGVCAWRVAFLSMGVGKGDLS